MSNGDAPSRKKALMAGAIGNFVEWYDFSLYGFFATTIAAQFFPKTDSTAALLYTFSIFALSFLVRPLGAIAFGHLADRIGRRPALLISVLLMSAGTVGIGVLPGYANIGSTAAVLLLVARLVQGFSAGGESCSGSVFVIEHAPEGRRGRYASYLLISLAFGTVFGILVSLLISSTTTSQQLAAWGWRLPFVAAAPLALVGLYLRLRVEESPVFSALRTEGRIESAPVAHAIKVAKCPMMILIGFAMSNSVGSYLMASYLVAHLTRAAKFTQTQALFVLLVAYVVLIGGGMMAGRALDSLGKKRVAVASAIGLGVWAVPTFIYTEHGSVVGACIFVGVLAFLVSFTSTTTQVALVELFPPSVRTSASGLGYNITYALFGGTAPYFATWLVGKGYPTAPGFYLTALCCISAVAAAVGIGNRARKGAEPAHISGTNVSPQPTT